MSSSRSSSCLCIALLLLAACGGLRAEANSNDAVCAQLARDHTQHAPRLVYVKAEHSLCLLRANRVVYAARASHGREAGKKQLEGDQRTPEGRYVVSPPRPSARFGLFMAVSYPNQDDVRAAEHAGKAAGSAIGVHGPQPWYAFLGEAQSFVDHSDGCIVTDRRAIQQLARLITGPMTLDILAELPSGAQNEPRSITP